MVNIFSNMTIVQAEMNVYMDTLQTTEDLVSGGPSHTRLGNLHAGLAAAPHKSPL